jgi:hypothetical protein
MKAIASTRSRSAALTTVAGTIAGHSHDDWKAQRSSTLLSFAIAAL